MPYKQKIQPDPISKIANDDAADTTENSKTDNNHKDSKRKIKDNQMQESQSDGSIIKNQKRSKFTQKIVSKVKSWNSKDGKGLQEHKKGVSDNTKRETSQSVVDTELAHDLEGITLHSSESDEGVPQPEHLKARDSLENILSPKREEVSGEVSNSKSSPSTSQEKSVTTTVSHTDSHMANIKASSTDAIAKVLAWDPWDKLNRKNKREFKRRKAEKAKPVPVENNTNGTRIRSPIIKTKNRVRGYEEPSGNDDVTDGMNETYEYKPYKTKMKKSVEFINQVLVVYYANDEILAETTEPLKKETEQQIRNKEMRKGHIPATIVDRRRCINENFMSWF